MESGVPVADARNMIRTFERPKKSHHRRRPYVEAGVEPLEQGSSGAELRHALAEILEEIDTVLHENAERLGHR